MMRTLAILLTVLAGNLIAQTPVVLFQHGFENSTVGVAPGTNDPTVGTYVLTQITNDNVVVLTGADPGGPDGAKEGTKYLRYDMVRAGNIGAVAPFINAMFSSPVIASKTPFHVSFYKYRPNLGGYPQMILGNSAGSPSVAAHLLYTTAWPTNLIWRWYNGAYNDTTLVFSTGKWEFVEMDWDGVNMTGSIDGGTPTPLGTWATTDKLVDRLLFRNGNNYTYFYLDDIKVTTTAPIVVRSMLPLPGATGQSRKPLIQLELANGTKTLQPNSPQMFINNQAVQAAVTQTNLGGVDLAVVSYTPATSLVYGSTNTVKVVYSDTSAGQYTTEWSFAVVNGETVFADNYESSIQKPLPNSKGAAFEGTNTLAIKRIGAGRPEITGLAETNLTSVADDLISIAFSIRVDGGVIGLFTRDATKDVGQLNFFADTKVNVVGATPTTLAAPLISGAWNTIEIRYVNNSGIWNVSVNGSAFEARTNTAKGNLRGVRFNTTGTDANAWIDKIVISNLTANALLFKDGFEKGTSGVAPAADTPEVGRYSNVTVGTVANGLFVGQGLMEFTNTVPNAPQVGTYDPSTTALAVIGTGHGGTRYADLYQGLMRMDFSTPLPAGIKVHAEAWISWSAGKVSWGFKGENNAEFAKVTLNDAYGITLNNGSSEVDTGFGHTTALWEKYELDYTVGASQVTFTYMSNNVVTVPVTPVSKLTGLFFTEDDSLSSRASVDDVLVRADLGNLPVTNPQLNLSVAGNELTLTWSNAAGYVLQQNSNIANAAGWLNVPGGGVSPVKATLDPTGQRFYRLMKPF